MNINIKSWMGTPAVGQAISFDTTDQQRGYAQILSIETDDSGHTVTVMSQSREFEGFLAISGGKGELKELVPVGT